MRKELTRQWVRSFLVAVIFLTRLPFLFKGIIKPDELSNAGWAFPIVGAFIGLMGAIIFVLAAKLNLSSFVCSILTVLAIIIITGGLHEDGLADTIDGFGGGFDRVNKLRIMRDSAIGVFGTIAIVFSILIRSAVLSELPSQYWVFSGLIIAEALSRGILPLVTNFLTTARIDGLAIEFRRVPSRGLIFLAGFIIIVLISLIGIYHAALILLVSLITAGIFSLLVYQQIGGYTGDVLGAYQQIIEVAVLITIGVVAL